MTEQTEPTTGEQTEIEAVVEDAEPIVEDVQEGEPETTEPGEVVADPNAEPADGGV